MSFVPVASTSEIPPGGRKVVAIGDFEVALFHLGDAYYAIENTCPHQGAPLSEGWVEGTVVTCPWHAWCFSLTTGKMTLGDFASVASFEVQISGSSVCVASEPRRP